MKLMLIKYQSIKTIFEDYVYSCMLQIKIFKNAKVRSKVSRISFLGENSRGQNDKIQPTEGKVEELRDGIVILVGLNISMDSFKYGTKKI